MTKATQILVGLSMAAAMGAVNATPPKTEPCKTGCGGTTTPVAGNQTTTVGVTNNLGLENNIAIKPTTTSSATSSSGVVIESGGIKAEGGKGGTAAATATTGAIDNSSGAKAETGPVSQSIQFKDRLQAPAVMPASPSVSYGAGINLGADASPEAICAATAMGGSGWAFGVSVPGAGGTITRSPGVLGYQVVDKDGKVNNELTVKFADCVEKVSEHQRLVRTGKVAPAIVLVNDLNASPALEAGRAEIAQYAHCPDKIEAAINRGCPVPAGASSVTDNVKNFGAAAQGVPQQEVCPANTVRAGKPALWSEQIQKYICG